MSLLAVQTFAQEGGITEDKENFHIFLLMGQSNMEGRNSIDGEMDTVTDPRILKLSNLGWVEARDPITNNYDVAVGPGLAFAKKLIAENPDIKVGLVPLAVGGTKIAQWMKGGEYYGPTLNAAAVARRQGVIKGILWHQGEHDGILAGTADVYDVNLKTLVDDLRVDLGNPDLPFIVGGLAEGIKTNPFHVTAYRVWNKLQWVATHFYQMGYVLSHDVPYLSDNLHFTSDGQRIMGERYADVYLKMMGHWLAIGKQWLDETSTDMGNGWKWNAQYGLYYDADFPIIKHEQLGWVKVDVFADMTLSIDSPVYGHFRTLPGSLEDIDNSRFYIYRENIQPEDYEIHGDTYMVNLLADSGANDAFLNIETMSWSPTVENSPAFNQINEIYGQAETEFRKTQQALADMSVAIATGTTWSEMTQLRKSAEQSWKYTLIYAFEAYNFTNTNLTGDMRDFWMGNSLNLINGINEVVMSAQELWTSYTIDLYSR